MSLVSHQPTTWKAGNLGTDNVKATATQAAVSTSGQRLVINWLNVMIVGGASAPAAKTVSVAIINGASGGTDYAWGPQALAIPAVAGAVDGIAMANLSIPGKPNTALTIEFSVAGGSNTIQSVDMGGTVTDGL